MSGDWNLAQTFGALLGGWIRWNFAALQARLESIKGKNNKEINGGRREDKHHRRCDQVADRKQGVADGELDGREIRLSKEKRDEWIDQAIH